MGKLTEPEESLVAASVGLADKVYQAGLQAGREARGSLSPSEQTLAPQDRAASALLAFLDEQGAMIDTTHGRKGGFYICRERESDMWVVETYSATTDKLLRHDHFPTLREAIASVMK